MDTATRATTVALMDTDARTEAACRDDPPAGARPRHTTCLLVLAAETLSRAGVTWGDIDLIAVGIGPGTFTGIRIGVATARALAAARDIPIVGVPTLHALAAGGASAAAAAGRAPLAILDARRREVFAAGWSSDGASDAASSAILLPRALAPEALAAELAGTGEGGRWLAVGDGAVDARELLQSAGVLVPEDDSPVHRVSAVELCRLAVRLPAGDVDSIRPEYLRIPDAELTRRTASAGRRS